MRCSRISALLLGATLLVFCLPAWAWAGDFSWDKPGDLTAAGSGSNPAYIIRVLRRLRNLQGPRTARLSGAGYPTALRTLDSSG